MSRLLWRRWWSYSQCCSIGCWRRRKIQGHPAYRCYSDPPESQGKQIKPLAYVWHLSVIDISIGLVPIILSGVFPPEIYIPRIWPGKRRFVGPSHTALSALPSSLGICRRSAVCPLPLAGDRCMMGWSDRCAQTNVCCTVKRKSEHDIWLVV